MTPWGGLARTHWWTDDARVSGADIAARASAWADALRAAGVRPREPVAIQGGADLRVVQAILAVRLAGACAAPIHASWGPAEVDAATRRLGARVLLAAAPAPPAAVALPPPDAALPVARLDGQAAVCSGDYALHTSGTEGTPKIVHLTEEAFAAHARASATRLDDRPGDRWLASLAPSHVGGLAILLRAAHVGRDVVVPSSPMPHDLSPVVRTFGVTHVSLVPTQLRRWLDADGGARAPPTLRVVLVGGAAAPAALVAQARARGWPVRTTYGFTEACSQVATSGDGSPPGSVGRPLDGAQVRLVGEDEADVPPGGTGRILVRAPWIMATYHGDANGTARRVREGWLWTDDLGRLDAGGDLWIAGRLGDRIVTGGEKVDPAEVEAALLAHDAVEDACVVGVPDEEWGERVVAAYVPRAGAAPTSADLRAWVRSRVAGYKCPRDFVVVDKIPRSPGGKPLRARMRAALTGRAVP